MPEVHVSPPYLRYDIVSDSAQIDTNRNAALAQLSPLPQSPLVELPLRTNVELFDRADPIEIPSPGSIRFTEITEAISAKTDLHASTTFDGANEGSINENASNIKKSEAVSGGKGNLRAASLVTTPSGNVPIGWWCPTGFHAAIFGSEQAAYEWALKIGMVDYSLLIETTDDGSSIFFGVDGNTYSDGISSGSLSLSTPLAVEMKLSCKITKKNWLGSDIPYVSEFDPVNLIVDPPHQQTPCITLLSASLPDEDTTTNGHPKLKGGDHGARPKLRVELSGKAHPVAGQIVFVRLNDPHNKRVGEWMDGTPGDTYSFVIAPGQVSADIDGFLKTRSVLSGKTISLTVKVNGNESAPLTLHIERK